jgi:glucosylceramidase
MMKNTRLLLYLLCIVISFNCTKKSSVAVTPNPPTPPEARPGPSVDYWITKTDGIVLLQKQPALKFGSSNSTFGYIDVDSTQTFQTIDGFGYTLTGGSAEVIGKLNASDRSTLLTELFGNTANSIGVSYLRISIGASDLNSSAFTYDDTNPGSVDISLSNFSLAKDQAYLIPLLKEILQINPSIKILATPWSAPAWMKDNGSLIGGSLLSGYYNVYALYFVRYIKEMKANGITIDAITPQNEPLNPGNNPSMVMTSTQQNTFIKNNLGPALLDAGLNTKIIAYDHNCDHPDYPLTILNDPATKQFVNGSAFHLYAGDINALTTVHNAHPDKAVYFTEQFTSSNGSFGGDLVWHIKNVIIGSMRNWSRVALEWNLANDPLYGPHTPGGCTECKGALTIGESVGIYRNVAYYNIAHASKFIPPGSVRVSSTGGGTLQHVAFTTPAKKKVLIVLNEGASTSINIRFNNKSITTTIPSGVATFVW